MYSQSVAQAISTDLWLTSIVRAWLRFLKTADKDKTKDEETAAANDNCNDQTAAAVADESKSNKYIEEIQQKMENFSQKMTDYDEKLSLEKQEV